MGVADSPPYHYLQSCAAPGKACLMMTDEPLEQLRKERAKNTEKRTQLCSTLVV